MVLLGMSRQTLLTTALVWGGVGTPDEGVWVHRSGKSTAPWWRSLSGQRGHRQAGRRGGLLVGGLPSVPQSAGSRRRVCSSVSPPAPRLDVAGRRRHGRGPRCCRGQGGLGAGLGRAHRGSRRGGRDRRAPSRRPTSRGIRSLRVISVFLPDTGAATLPGGAEIPPSNPGRHLRAARSSPSPHRAPRWAPAL